MEHNLYQGKREAVEWQSAYGCYIETLPIVTGYLSHFALY